MLETDRYSKNEFNPMLNQIFNPNRLMFRKSSEPFRIRPDVHKYQYVVDWQIEDDVKPGRNSENFQVF